MHHKTLYRTVTLAHANKSGGRKPPVVTRPRIATASANSPAAVSGAIAEAPVQVRQRDTRRAHAPAPGHVRLYTACGRGGFRMG